jgi:hypothetical protein
MCNTACDAWRAVSGSSTCRCACGCCCVVGQPVGAGWCEGCAVCGCKAASACCWCDAQQQQLQQPSSSSSSRCACSRGGKEGKRCVWRQGLGCAGLAPAVRLPCVTQGDKCVCACVRVCVCACVRVCVCACAGASAGEAHQAALWACAACFCRGGAAAAVVVVRTAASQGRATCNDGAFPPWCVCVCKDEVAP